MIEGLRSNATLRRLAGREVIKTLVGAMVRWESVPLRADRFSIVLGVPWDLRHLLPVNLRFVRATDLRELHRVHVVFDRCHRPGVEELIGRVRAEFSELPLEFQFYPTLAGRLVEQVHVSTFYNSMNTVLALRECMTKYAVLHDFDLYPLRADHFTSIVGAMRERSWRFSGHELTHFDGLTDEDLQIGTWTLGIDVEWLRANWRPIDCFHRVERVRGRLTNLDPYAAIQFKTPERGLAGAMEPDGFCHVKNLCSTYLRFLKRGELKVAWRLHYLWYLEALSGLEHRVREVTDAMRRATSAVLEVDRLPADFTGVHVTCVNVLRSELTRMDRALFGEVRPETTAYVDEFRRFLTQFGSTESLKREDGSVRWSMEMAGAFDPA